MSPSENLCDVSVVLPIYNERGHLRDEITRIQKALDDSKYSYEIIVIDNASTDDTNTGLTKWHSQLSTLRVDRMSHNTGFSPACNRGAEMSEGRYLLFLNKRYCPNTWMAAATTRGDRTNRRGPRWFEACLNRYLLD